ncbi:hypothetical protein CsSME_00055073 [Camellia sinensis var. sinensis]
MIFRFIYFLFYLHIMDLSGPIHDFLLVFLGLVLILGSLGVILFPNPISSAFSLDWFLFVYPSSIFYRTPIL